MSTLGGPLFRQTFLFLVLVELFSLCGYLYPVFNTIAFFVIAAIALIVTLHKLEYGVYLLLIELFTGSKGFLFFLDLGGTIFSIRMALWLIVMGVWGMKCILRTLDKSDIQTLRSEPLLRWLYALGAFVCIGVVNGWLRGNAMQDIFLDMNAWLFFLLIFPFVSTLKTKQHFTDIVTILIASTFFTSIKVLCILFVFSHDPLHTIYGPLYRWLRTTGVGEATAVSMTFVRIFLQSQIYTVIAFFALMVERGRTDHRLRWWVISVLLCSSIILSFSRSFWVGAAAACIVSFAFIGWRFVPRIVFSITGAGLLILLVMRFPYPTSLGSDFLFAFQERVSESEDAGVGSRWNLLTPLLAELRSSPVLGKGFGSTVTYRSNDPRIVQSSAVGNNLYTTYAFEWGYLDLWLKIGLGGLLFYCMFLWNILRRCVPVPFSQRYSVSHTGRLCAVGIVIVAVTNIFSPYLNHPLGIGFVIVSCVAAFTVGRHGEESSPLS